MRITVASASTKTGRATIQALLDVSPPDIEIHGLYRNISNVPADFKAHASFRAVQGDMLAPSTLDFQGSDAVLITLPPILDGEDSLVKVEKMSNAAKEAIERSSTVKKLVLLSSNGAEFEKGVVGSHSIVFHS